MAWYNTSKDYDNLFHLVTVSMGISIPAWIGLK